MRHYIVLLHRYVGLTMAAFLLIAGVTGRLIVWHQELDAALTPAMLKVTPPTADARPLDPLLLRDKVLAAYPLVLSEYVPQKVAPDQVLMFYVYGKPDSAKGEYVELPVSRVNANINNVFDKAYFAGVTNFESQGLFYTWGAPRSVSEGMRYEFD